MYSSKNRKPYNSMHAKPYKPGGAAKKGSYIGHSMKRPKPKKSGNVHEM